MEENDISLCTEKKQTLIETIDKLIKKNRKNKALLSLKYDDISSRINFVQVSVIVISTGITFLETLKSKYSINEDIGTILPIIFSTYIALVLAIVRFFKLDEKKEDISKTVQNYNFIINKLRKTLNTLKLFEINEGSIEKWKTICSNYENDTYDFIVSTRESFDNIMPFKHVNYYKKKYRKILLDCRFVNNELKMIDHHHTDFNHLKYDQKEHWCIYIFKSIFCCKRRKILYHNFLEDVEQLLNEDDEIEDDDIQESKISTI
tara:strand:- start:75 stop:860 length:786 start_codon:yes stop_codon:yes gene_type:complete